MANGEPEGAAAGAGREADEFLSLESLLDKKRTTTSADKVKAKRDLISYTPTMFIGLGGTGAKTVDALKGRFLQRNLTDPIFSFLVFDIAEEESHDLLHLDKTSEFHCMELDDSAKYIRNHRGLVRDWWDESYTPPRKLTDGGARAVRANGRLCFFHHALNNVFAELAPAANTIKARVANTPIAKSEPIVYIIASLCGGTGSGTFLDMAFLVRHAFSQLGEENVQVVGVFVLNDVYEKLLVPVDWMVLKRNTYAALKELEHFMLPSCPEVAEEKTIQYAERRQLSVTYSRPYDLIYLMGASNASGVNVMSTRQMAFMLADGIFLQVATPLGTRAKGAFVFRAAGLLREMHNERLCCYSSLGVGSLVYPREQILDYGIWTLLADQCLLLTGNNIGDAKTQALAASFIKKQGIAAPDLRDKLSTTRQDRPYEYNPIPDLQRALNRVRGSKYADAIDTFEADVTNKLAHLRIEMATKAKELVAAAVAQARADAHSLFAKGAGLGAARDYLAAIDREDNDDDEDAIAGQLGDATQRLDQANARARAHVDRIGRLKGLVDRFTKLDGYVEEYERALSDRVRLEIEVSILKVCRAFYAQLDKELGNLRGRLITRLIEPIAELGGIAGKRKRRAEQDLAKLDQIHPLRTDRTHVKLIVPFARLQARIQDRLSLSPKDAAAGLAKNIPSICDYAGPALEAEPQPAGGGPEPSRRSVVGMLKGQASERCKAAGIVSDEGAVAALREFSTDPDGKPSLEVASRTIREFYDTVQPQWHYSDEAFNRSAQLAAIGVGVDNEELIAQGFTPKPVPATTCDLSAIPTLRTEHGVPLCVLDGIQGLRNSYDEAVEERKRYAAKGKPRPPLHLFGTECVNWDEPAECGSFDDDAVTLFAIGIAIGHLIPPTQEEQAHMAEPWARHGIFARQNRYFVQPYFTRADVAGGRVQPPEPLGGGRHAAFEAFCKDSKFQDYIARFEEERLIRMDPADLHARLLDYVEQQLKPRLKSARSSKSRKLIDILERELERLQERLEALRQEVQGI